MGLDLAPEFVRRIEGAFGADGEAWLKRLPALIATCEQRWRLEAGPPFPNLSYNYAAPARASDGSEHVLKMGVPRAELTREIEALRHYDGRGSVRLSGASPEEGVLLLERLRPGAMLVDLVPEDDERATVLGAGVMQALWQPVPPEGGFKSIEAWFAGHERLRRRFDGGCGPFPRHLVESAESLYAQLRQSWPPPMLLHGDLHHYNILSAARAPWLAIDPKGMTGESTYDTAVFLSNPLDLPDWPNLRSALERRVAILSEMLLLDRWRILAWGIAHTVLSAWWSYEENNPRWSRILPVAEELSALIT